MTTSSIVLISKLQLLIMFELALVDDLLGFPMYVNRNNANQLQRYLDGNGRNNHSLMNMDFIENEKGYVLNAELPGYDKDKISLSLKDGVLTLEAEKEECKSESKETYHFKERSWGKVHRSFRLPMNANQNDVKTSYVNGVLNVTFPKVEQEPPKKLTIS